MPDFYINPDFAIKGSEIQYVGDGKSHYSVLDFHHIVQELFDDEDFMTMLNPTVRHTDRLIELINGYSITPEALSYLGEGNIFSSRRTIKVLTSRWKESFDHRKR